MDNKQTCNEIVLNEEERENLLLYKIQGGGEVNQVHKKISVFICLGYI
jgi:hypothetical protein